MDGQEFYILTSLLNWNILNHMATIDNKINKKQSYDIFLLHTARGWRKNTTILLPGQKTVLALGVCFISLTRTFFAHFICPGHRQVCTGL